jgi:hypothetical protein
VSSASVEAVLAEGVAALAAAAGVDSGVEWTHKLMPDAPDRQLTIWVYRTGRDPVTRLDRYAAQIRGRGVRDDVLDVDELMGPVADWFAEIEHVDVGSVHIDQVVFRSSAPMGSDSSNRTERADTFDLDITPPPTARRPV